MAGVISPTNETCTCGAPRGRTFRGEAVCFNPTDHDRNLAIAQGKLCAAASGPDSEDPTVYHCNRKQPHKTLHAELGPDGMVIACWCSCSECSTATEDIE